MMISTIRRRLLVVAAAIALAVGCASGELEVPEEEDDNGSAVDNDEAARPAEGQPRLRVGTASGTGSSENYRASVSFGTPAPAGSAEGENYRATVGIGPAVSTSQGDDDDK